MYTTTQIYGLIFISPNYNNILLCTTRFDNPFKLSLNCVLINILDNGDNSTLDSIYINI